MKLSDVRVVKKNQIQEDQDLLGSHKLHVGIWGSRSLDGTGMTVASTSSLTSLMGKTSDTNLAIHWKCHGWAEPHVSFHLDLKVTKSRQNSRPFWNFFYETESCVSFQVSFVWQNSRQKSLGTKTKSCVSFHVSFFRQNSHGLLPVFDSWETNYRPCIISLHPKIIRFFFHLWVFSLYDSITNIF